MENEEIKNPEEYWRDHWKDQYERLYELDCELIRETQKFSWMPLIMWLVVSAGMLTAAAATGEFAGMLSYVSTVTIGYVGATLTYYILRPQMPPWWGKMNRS